MKPQTKAQYRFTVQESDTTTMPKEQMPEP
jgi:hypothetical protein